VRRTDQPKLACVGHRQSFAPPTALVPLSRAAPDKALAPGASVPSAARTSSVAMLRPGLPLNVRLKTVHSGVVCPSASAHAGCILVVSNAPRCPPASIPCAMITSAPAASAAFASANVVAVVNHEIRRDFNSETNDGGYNPIIEETAAGASRSNAWHAHRNSAES